MKEKILKKKIIGRLFSVVLALILVVALMPIFGITVHAAAHQCKKCTACEHAYSVHDTGWCEYCRDDSSGACLQQTTGVQCRLLDGHPGVCEAPSSSGPIWKKYQGHHKTIWYDATAARAEDIEVAVFIFCEECTGHFTWLETDGDGPWTEEETCPHIVTEDPTGSSGGNSDVTKKTWKGDSFGITFIAPQDFDLFLGSGKVFVDNKELVKDVDYEAKRGSTIITLKQAFLATLSQGSHSFKITFSDDSSYDAELIIDTASPAPAPAPATSPKTGDNNGIGLIFAIISVLFPF